VREHLERKMKRYLFLMLAVALILTGCASAQTKDPFKVDTVVVIPEKPTAPPKEEPTEPPTEAQEEQTEAPTERPTVVLAVPEATKPKQTVSSSKTSSGKTSNKTSSSNTQKPKATEPPVAEPPAVEHVPPVEMPTEPPYDPASYNIGNLEHVMLDILNVYRLDAGIEVLSIDRKLSGIAFLRAQEAVEYWSHIRPDGRGYISALADYGYPYTDAAELLVYATGNGDPVAMVSKWMNMLRNIWVR
jgi:uncharacterized protein YkwD